MPTFFTAKRLFRVPLHISTPGPYAFDLLALFFVLGTFLGLDDLKSINQGASVAVVPANAFALVGVLGLYGIRLSMWVAILRRNRMPQTLEWVVCLAPLAATLTCFAASGLMVQAYAEQHHYRRCADQRDHGSNYVFAAPQAACPAPVQAADWGHLTRTATTG